MILVMLPSWTNGDVIFDLCYTRSFLSFATNVPSLNGMRMRLIAFEISRMDEFTLKQSGENSQK